VAESLARARVVRPATLADLSEVASWIATARDCELWAGWRVKFPIDRTSLPEAIGFAEHSSFSLVSGRDLVAFGQLVGKDQGRGHLARLIVKPALRGRGHGEALVAALLERAQREAFACVSLNVDSANERAATLYLKLGFADASRPADEPLSPGTRYMELAQQ
jgi:ribosomal protein S18 acetylase RimI-like enzyme